MLLGRAILWASNKPGQDRVWRWLNFHSREMIHALQPQTLGTYMTSQNTFTTFYTELEWLYKTQFEQVDILEFAWWVLNVFVLYCIFSLFNVA